eukprot:TRINITY_DN3202_c0_g1_i1.p1 TRINITY_DN3202_c0_g1~~TRINITY_DN3202_c0_g1_i1.p1  ORF type:complete len:171 (-),score=22.66 TRINITY_DN3202_c0_g1_i1:13-525(-)
MNHFLVLVFLVTMLVLAPCPAQTAPSTTVATTATPQTCVADSGILVTATSDGNPNSLSISYDAMTEGGVAATKTTSNTKQLMVGIKIAEVFSTIRIWWTGVLDLTNTWTCNGLLDTNSLQFASGDCGQVNGVGTVACVAVGSMLNCTTGGASVVFVADTATIVGDVAAKK